MSSDLYNFDYYERGPEKGVSCYQNYRWLPLKTIPTVMTYIDHLGITRDHSVLDFGCAKGYYVKALRALYRNAWGCDVSKYAVSCADEDVKQFVRLCTDKEPIPFANRFDYIIAKDVLEHMGEGPVLSFLKAAQGSLYNSGKIFIIVPLAEKGKYIIPSDELDTTHVIRKSYKEWAALLTFGTGFVIDDFRYTIPGIKDHQAIYPEGVGFFTLSKEEY